MGEIVGRKEKGKRYFVAVMKLCLAIAVARGAFSIYYGNGARFADAIIIAAILAPIIGGIAYLIGFATGDDASIGSPVDAAQPPKYSPVKVDSEQEQARVRVRFESGSRDANHQPPPRGEPMSGDMKGILWVVGLSAMTVLGLLVYHTITSRVRETTFSPAPNEGVSHAISPSPALAPAPGGAVPSITGSEPALALKSESESAVADSALAKTNSFVGMTPNELRSRGSLALSQQRLYAPAGDNAMEYYLALRERSSTPDAAVESALIDLNPYVVVAAEQAAGREDFAEAERLRALLERAGSHAPALPGLGLAAMTPNELRASGSLALSQQRLFAPAGDNALEYYLALRDRSSTPDESVESTLIYLRDNALRAEEQAFDREDFVEVEHFRALVERIDPRFRGAWRAAKASPPIPEMPIKAGDANFSVPTMYAGPAANVLISSELDNQFRTRIRAAASEPVNFAGEYTLSLWGCGTECLMGVAVSKRTGKVVWLPGTVCCARMDTTDRVVFEPNSTLLTLYGRVQEGDVHGVHLYALVNDEFVHQQTVPVEPIDW